MKIIIRMLLLCLITWVVSPSGRVLAEEVTPPADLNAPMYGTSILKNSGFEADANDTKWIEWSDAVNSDGIQIVESPVSSGTQAYRITEEDLPAEWKISGIIQTAPIRPDEWYTLNADVFIEALEEDPVSSHYTYKSLVTIELSFLDVNSKKIPATTRYLDVNQESENYKKHSITGISPSNAKYVKVSVHLKARTAGGGGTVYVDNVELVYDWAPKYLHHSGKTNSTIDLVWTEPSDMSEFSEYEIYQYNEVTETDELIATTEDPLYTVTGLSTTTAYTFTVKAKKENGYVSKSTYEWRTATAAVEGFTTIMPLGASMTHGYNVVGGYRYPLSQSLENAGLLVDFVGSRTANAHESMIDREHQGHPGDRADHIAIVVDEEVVVYEPDIVLLFAGTNDMFDSVQADTAHEDIELILSKITSKLPNTRVIVSSITRLPIDSVLLDPRVINYNNKIANIVKAYKAQGKNVGFVDIYPLITEEYFPPIDLKNDKIHPDVDGFNKMSTVWYDAVHAVMTSSTKDIEAKNPTQPNNLAYVLDDNNHAILNWGASTDNIGVTAYKVKINDMVSTVTKAVYTTTTINLDPETPYSVKVIAVDAAGNESGPSNEIFVPAANGEIGSDVQAPMAPTELRATDVTDSTIKLVWTPSNDNVGVTEYLLQMNGSYYGSVTDAVYTVVNELTPGTTYTFTVAAKDAAGNISAFSNQISTTTELIEPEPDTSLKQPTYLRGGAITAESVELLWNASIDSVGPVLYTVEIIGVGHKENIATTSYTVTGLEPNTIYQFKVSAIDDRGIPSPPSMMFSYSTGKAPINDSSVGNNGNSFPMPIVTTDDKLVYTETAAGTKLQFAPNEQKALDSLNDNNQALLLDISDDKPFDQLELELTGKLLTLAEANNKSVIVKFGEFNLELPPGFVELDENDTIVLNIEVSTFESDQAMKQQSLNLISHVYDLELLVNGKVVSSFVKALKLTLSPMQEGDMELSNIFFFDPSTSSWEAVSGRVTKSGAIAATLSHFSRYALLKSSKTFDDITNHWAKLDIEALAAKQIVSGMTSELFDPDGDVTRAQFASMIARALHLEAVDANTVIPFTDVQEDSWYYAAVSSAYQAKIISGVSVDKFSPNERITREQMAVMIVNAYRFYRGSSMDQMSKSLEELPYKDMERISNWALPYVRIASELGLIMGADGQFNPIQYGDRSQSAAIINRLLKLPIE